MMKKNLLTNLWKHKCLSLEYLDNNGAKYSYQHRHNSVISGWFKNDSHAINKAVSQAEKIIGFPTSYLSIRALLSDELSSVVTHVQKLASSKHPLLSTARGILFDSEHSVQVRGLVVLLISKLLSANLKEKRHFDTSKVFQNQRLLAELTEMLHIGFLIHRGIINRRYLLKVKEKEMADMEVGNKLSVLSGDYLFATACIALSALRNSKVVSQMSSAIGDMSQGFFMLPESGEFSFITSAKNLPSDIESWQEKIHLAHASLLINACRSAAELVDVNKAYGEICENFAKNMIFAQQARLDIDRIRCKSLGRKNIPMSSELCALPVVIAADANDGWRWMERFLEKTDCGDWMLLKDKLFSEMQCLDWSFDEAESVCEFHKQAAVDALLQLPGGEPRRALISLTHALTS